MEVKPESLAFMNDLPIYRITFAALGLFGCLLRVALSGIMVRLTVVRNANSRHDIPTQTMVVATFSARRYLLKYVEFSYVSSAFRRRRTLSYPF